MLTVSNKPNRKRDNITPKTKNKLLEMRYEHMR